MGIVKDFILQLDLFAHPQYFRYRQQPGYRTLTGGILSVILVAIFAAMFASLVIDTFQNNIILSQTSVIYDTDPTYYELTASPSNKYMFAVGIVGLDLSSAQRYFDIDLETYSVTNNVKTIVKVPMTPCVLSQWSGINDKVTSQYTTLSFKQWLCPPQGYVFPIQGKRTSTTFKYVKITVSKCGTTQSNSTCVSSTVVDTFITNNQGATLNFYYINPILNTAESDYIDYYLEDTNYFSFNTNLGVSANLFYSEYQIETDHSILPWSDKSTDAGALTISPANLQLYSVINTNAYAKIYLRKASQMQSITRTFQKVDQTLSYIGGLLGFVILLLTFMGIYSKFCYEIEFGEKLFKQNNNGNFGSEDFNFIVYLGYGFYNILTMLGIYLNWTSMKKYHECRIECMKQLDMELLFKKLDFFEAVSNVMLEDHHIKGLHLLPKKKIRDAKKTRKRFLLQNLIYHHLDRKAREVYVEEDEFDRRYDDFLNENKEAIVTEIIKEHEEREDVKDLKQECARSFRKLYDHGKQGQPYSRRIIDKIGMKDLCATIVRMSLPGVLLNMAGQVKKGQADQPYPSISNLVREDHNIDTTKNIQAAGINERDIEIPID